MDRKSRGRWMDSFSEKEKERKYNLPKYGIVESYNMKYHIVLIFRKIYKKLRSKTLYCMLYHLLTYTLYIDLKTKVNCPELMIIILSDCLNLNFCYTEAYLYPSVIGLSCACIMFMSSTYVWIAGCWLWTCQWPFWGHIRIVRETSWEKLDRWCLLESPILKQWKGWDK